MIKAYINYPNPEVRLHCDLNCGFISKKPNREISITMLSLSNILQTFIHHEYRFAAEAGLNDMWLSVDLNDHDLEVAVIEFITRKLAERYSPFGRIKPQIHCG